MADKSNIIRKSFSDISLDDPFFTSLRESYEGFDDWFAKKAETGAQAYVMYKSDGHLLALVHTKTEHGPVTDIEPPLNTSVCLKIGTFKIDAHGTKLGERFVKKVFDEAISRSIKHIYLTVFPKHVPLINILMRYGFTEHGNKTSPSGAEKVFVKDLNKASGNALLDYPTVDARECNKWLLSIYPKYHSKLFPDSILKTEKTDIIEDLSHTNSIHKVYIAFMKGMHLIRPGDALIIYRAAEKDKRPWFASVATSLCVVEDVRPRKTFGNREDFITYSQKNSIFDTPELDDLYKKQPPFEMHVLKMLYNIAFPKRPTMGRLVEEAGLDRKAYWGFRQLTDQSFHKIIQMGAVDEGVIIY